MDNNAFVDRATDMFQLLYANALSTLKNEQYNEKSRNVDGKYSVNNSLHTWKVCCVN